MTRRRLVRIALCLMLLAGVALGGLWWASSRVPAFYSQALANDPPPAVRKAEAKKLTQRAMQLIDDVKHKPTFAAEFSQRQLNSWLAEELPAKFSEYLPDGAADPRLHIDGTAILVGFRYAHSGWNGVVSIRITPWIPQPNQLALKVESVKAGLLPVPLSRILQEVAASFEGDGRKVELRQENGHDVLLVHLAGKKAVLEKLQVVSGAVRVQGRRIEPAQTKAGKTGSAG